MRMQALGIIKNYEFNSFILGSSMLENTSSKEASKKLNSKFINISLAGSDYFERKILIDYLMKTKKVDKIIYSLDWYSHHKQRKGHPTYPIKTYEFLYDDILLNDWKLYLNRKYFKCLLTYSSKKECVGSKENIDRLNAWFESKSVEDKYGGVKKWLKYKSNGQIKQSIDFLNTNKIKTIGKAELNKKLQKVKLYLDEYIINLVKKYNNTEFLFVFPPYFRAWHSINSRYAEEDFKIHIFTLRYLVEKSKLFKNMKIYSFDNEEFTADISNYKDLGHFHYRINSKILDKMKKSDFLKPNNVDSYICEFKSLVKGFNLLKLKKDLKSNW